MIGGEKKNQIIRHSQVLIFPVLNYEAFGLAMIESLYLRCPVIGSHCSSLPELITPDVDNKCSKQIGHDRSPKNIHQFSRKT